VTAGGRADEKDPKLATSRRTLPLPDRVVNILLSAKASQAAERLSLGGAFEYIVSNEAGEPYSPAVLSRYWRDTSKAASDTLNRVVTLSDTQGSRSKEPNSN
jgi:integrase